jgi:VanZ family protein
MMSLFHRKLSNKNLRSGLIEKKLRKTGAFFANRLSWVLIGYLLILAAGWALVWDLRVLLAGWKGGMPKDLIGWGEFEIRSWIWKFCVFLPIGAALAIDGSRWLGRRCGLRLVAGIGLGVGIALEIIRAVVLREPVLLANLLLAIVGTVSGMLAPRMRELPPVLFRGALAAYLVALTLGEGWSFDFKLPTFNLSGLWTMNRIWSSQDALPSLLLLGDELLNLWIGAPLGALLVLGFGRNWSLRTVLSRAALFGLGVSLTMEGMQLFVPERVSSLCDVVCNTLGAISGGAAFYMMEKYYRQRMEDVGSSRIVNT